MSESQLTISPKARIAGGKGRELILPGSKTPTNGPGPYWKRDRNQHLETKIRIMLVY
jgi:hypothetical protein